MTLLVLVALLLALAAAVVLIYNALVRRKIVVAEAWSGIEAQLKRRADLIPNLVETVKGYATHERSTLDELTRLRSQGQAQTDVAQRAQTENAITGALTRLFALAENYPDLKASANFQSLQGELATIEDQIQLARRYYNGAVRDLNVLIGQFPSNLVAAQAGFTPAAFFEIEDAADRTVPKVAFT